MKHLGILILQRKLKRAAKRSTYVDFGSVVESLSYLDLSKVVTPMDIIMKDFQKYNNL